MDMIIIFAGIILALLFNFVNGLNDAANSIATVIATRALTPLQAVGMAAVFNMIGPFLFSTAIAKTIGKGLIESSLLTPYLVFAAMFGAVLWVFVSSVFGIPVSSSHALVGGIVGAGIAMGGVTVILWPEISTVYLLVLYTLAGTLLITIVFSALLVAVGEDWRRYLAFTILSGIAVTIPALIISGLLEISGILAIIVFIVVSPMLGFIAAFLLGILMMRHLRNSNPAKVNRNLRPLQIIAGAWQSVGHGANDAQNAMGMITAMLFAAGMISVFEVPLWVIISSCLAISIGTMLGGWRVIDKMAHKITKIRPYQGFSSAVAGGAVLSLMTSFGVPVSTTHAISGSIMGAGSTRGYSSAVRWNNVREIVMAWFITIPASAFVSGIVYLIISIYI
ncbi:inorganic phosphate transporter [Methanolacinia paynteri]|uniref:inorganic phosphate transporter n=1 Tax=Methanolacinia paynteri TaxID=230356 RepID=UPI00064F89EC|nr:inorganic phosphate transporter [Methanolacinia paynteri]